MIEITGMGWFSRAIQLEGWGLSGAVMEALALSYLVSRRERDLGMAREARAAFVRVQAGGVI